MRIVAAISVLLAGSGVTTAAAPTSRAVAVQATTADLDFSYAYPAVAARYPLVVALLDLKRRTLRREAASEAADDHKDARARNSPFHRHEAHVTWAVVTETPRFLSLSAEIQTYSGGAHGMTASDTLVWDKPAAAIRAPIDLFDAAALQRAAGTPLCRAVDAERGRRRGGPVVRSDDPFAQCVPVKDTTVILGSTDRRAIDRIGFLIGPYVAGPYSEGAYEATLPLTPAILAAVKPQFRAGFAVRR